MAEQSSPSPPRRRTPPPPPPQYVEVNCRSSGKTRRFAAGTDAGFAVALMNRKLKGTVAIASHIEAVKDGEEPIAFGPTSLLSNFGDGWKLQTVTLADLSSEVRNVQFQRMAKQTPPGPVSSVPDPAGRVSNPISFVYLVKIMFAFILIFFLEHKVRRRRQKLNWPVLGLVATTMSICGIRNELQSVRVQSGHPKVEKILQI